MRKLISNCMAGYFVIGLLSVGVQVLGQDRPDYEFPFLSEGTATSADADEVIGGQDADLDNLLNMDLQALAEAPVLQATITDPIVDAISKTPEKASEAPGIVHVITAQDIEDFGAKNLYEVLERATSVYMSGSFLFRRNMASIRGNLLKHEDNHALVLINGRPFRDATLGGVNVSIYTAFPLQTVDRIEVIRGPGSVLYGTNAFTGVINIVTKNPDKPILHASVLSGTHGWQSYSVAAGNGNEHSGVLSGATYSRQKGWPFTATSEDPPGPNGPFTYDTRYGEDNAGVFAMYRNHGFTANLFVAQPSSTAITPLPFSPLGTLQANRVFVDLGYLCEIDNCQSLSVNFQ